MQSYYADMTKKQKGPTICYSDSTKAKAFKKTIKNALSDN